MRMNIFGNIMRMVHSGIAAGVMKPCAAWRGIDLAGAQAGADELGILDHLREHTLDMQMRIDLGGAPSRTSPPS